MTIFLLRTPDDPSAGPGPGRVSAKWSRTTGSIFTAVPTGTDRTTMSLLSTHCSKSTISSASPIFNAAEAFTGSASTPRISEAKPRRLRSIAIEPPISPSPTIPIVILSILTVPHSAYYTPYQSKRFIQPFGIGTQGDADVVASVMAKNAARGHKNAGFVKKIVGNKLSPCL